MESASNLVDYTWDPLNRLSLVEPLTGTISMLYDGDSKRIEKIVDGTAKQYIHDDNNLLQETDDSGNVEKEYGPVQKFCNSYIDTMIGSAIFMG